jgi:hypothetical protein
LPSEISSDVAFAFASKLPTNKHVHTAEFRWWKKSKMSHNANIRIGDVNTACIDANIGVASKA